MSAISSFGIVIIPAKIVEWRRKQWCWQIEFVVHQTDMFYFTRVGQVPTVPCEQNVYAVDRRNGKMKSVAARVVGHDEPLDVDVGHVLDLPCDLEQIDSPQEEQLPLFVFSLVPSAIRR